MNNYHLPVLLTEVLENLQVKKDRWYVDCNLGGGGHSEAILARGGKVVGIDLDSASIEHVKKNLASFSKNLRVVQNNFIYLKHILKQLKINKVSGVLFDLGVSSHQLDEKQRGFSFLEDAPLDMRMDQHSPLKAADLVNGLGEKELADIFFKYGEERLSRPIAKKIVQVRKEKPILTTLDLVKIITQVKRSDREKIHPATRVFQALRIAVNDELGSLKIALPQALEILDTGGRLVVISFHSLEDRIVKNFFKEASTKNLAKIITKKPIVAQEGEVISNPRSRSAKMRVLEKL